MLPKSGFGRFFKMLKLLPLLIVAVCSIGTASVSADEFPRQLNAKEGQGYGNSVGIFSIPPQFQIAYGFKDGVALVQLKNGKYGYIDVKGNFVVQPQFDEIFPLEKGGLTRVRNWLPGSVPRVGFVNEKGEIVIPLTFEYAYQFAPNGLSHARESVRAGGSHKNGFIDRTGNVAIPFVFDDARSFGANGLAAVKVIDKWGFINAKGEFVIHPKYSEVPISPGSVFDANGLAQVKQAKWGYIDSAGEWIGPSDFDEVGSFGENGLARVGKLTVRGDMKYGVLNTKGKYVFEPQFDRMLGYVNGFAQVVRGGKWGYIDTKGNVVVRPQFDSYGKDFDENGIAEVITSKLSEDKLQYGYINTAGEFVVKPRQFDYVRSGFDSKGFLIVRSGGKYAYVNSKGEVALKWYEDAHPFSESGLAAAKREGKYGYINTKGDFVIPPQFEDTYRFGPHGMSVAKLGGKWGYINTKGEFAIAPRFDLASIFETDGFARVTLNGQEGYVDIKGTFSPLP